MHDEFRYTGTTTSLPALRHFATNELARSLSKLTQGTGMRKRARFESERVRVARRRKPFFYHYIGFSFSRAQEHAWVLGLARAQQKGGARRRGAWMQILARREMS